MTDEEFEDHKKWAEGKTKEIEEFLNNLREGYRGMSKNELRQRLSIQTDDTLRWICVDIALPTEDYEICQMAKEVLEERGEKLIE